MSPRITSPSSLRHVATGAVLAAAFVAPATAAATPVTPIPSLDTQRYLGDWKQIAAIPQWYETLCVKDVSANYKLFPDGAVNVTNRCKGPLESNIVSKGKARILDKTTNAQLQVTFVNAFGQWFYPDNKPNYVVAGIGADYDWAVVADPDRSSGFVLSRTATLTADQKAQALAVLEANGYDACKLKTTRQTGGLTTVKPFCQA